MTKRKRVSAGTTNSGAKTQEGTSDGSEGRDKKRRKRSTSPNTDPAEICAELYDVIRNYRAEDGRILCESFIRVPKRRNSPEYYDVISTPIDLLKIQQRLKTDEYEDVETFSVDVELLLDNAIKFYSADMQEHKDAIALKNVFENAKARVCRADGEDDEEESFENLDDDGDASDDVDDDDNNDREDRYYDSDSKTKSNLGFHAEKRQMLHTDDDDNESTSTRDDEEADSSSNALSYCEELVSAVLEMKDSHGRIICHLFKKLPPQSLYPEYYAIIKEPIDLKMICTRLRNNQYTSLEDVEKDLLLMVKNAHTFNEPGSQVYKDATAIKKTVQAKKAEIDHVLMGAKSSKRLIKARRSAGKMSASVTALLEETDDDAKVAFDIPDDDEHFADESIPGDEESVGDDQDAAENPLMMLFTEVYHLTDLTGRVLSEPFLRLPSRRGKCRFDRISKESIHLRFKGAPQTTRAYPDYYKVIKQPIGLSKIRSQIKSGQYGNLEELENDLDLCFANAETYNEPDSMLYKDAQRMREHMKRKKGDILRYMEEKGITMESENKKKKKLKRAEPDFPVREEQPPEVLKTKPKTEIRKPKRTRKVEEVDPIVLRKRMRQLYKAVVNYQDENGRYLSAIFVELPSAQDYPDYYQVISEPVCLSQIENNIRDNKYSSEDEVMLDFEVMFDNARYYNEEDSQVYQDACTLEKVLRKKKKSLGPINPVPTSETGTPASQISPTKQPTPTKSGRISSSPGTAKKYSQVPSATNELKELCRELFNAVKDCTDHGRQLCIIFQKLPSRAEYPDYYTLIKKPIDMTKINSKLYGDQYQTLDDFMSDFLLMFDNACRYNEPDSQVYKDALSLERELLRKKAELVGDESKIPNMQDVVRKLLNALYMSIMSHVDEDGRCYSDSLAELSVLPEGAKRPFTLSSIGEALRKGRYHRLDRFQEDLFSIFEKARETSRSDTETYDDAVELQQYFISQRDKLCKDGERFVSPALLVIKRHLQQELDEERKAKVEAESKEDKKQKELERNEGKQQTELLMSEQACEEELSYNDIHVRVGNFVYVAPREEKLHRHVVSVEKLWVDNNGEKWGYGSWFYRPEETFHTATRKFLEKELFRSDYCAPFKLSHVLGKCHVMFVKDYFKQKPEDFKEENVFVCESWYNIKSKSFKKIKVWSMPSSDVSYVSREEPLHPTRVPSVFVERAETRSQPMETEVEGQVIDDVKKNVLLESPQNAEEGCTYYEQFCVRDVPYKLGDCVYVMSEEGYMCMSRIDKMWTDRNGHTWSHGPWFINPADTQHLPSRMFYDKEVFLSSLEETVPVGNITGKCCVLPFREYVRCRPTEIPEKDIYLNEARYDEEEGQFRKLKGLKRYTLTVSVQEDEYYFFEKPITPGKAPSPLLIEDLDLLEDERTQSPSQVTADTTGDGTKKPKKQRGHSGYLLFSHEMRAAIRKGHPEYAFGEISRIIGVEWRNTSAQKKAEYEARAQMQLTQTESEASDSSQVLPSGPLMVYECVWRGCDYQYEDLRDLKIHLLDSTCHLHKSEDGLFHCLWTTCTRQRRGMRPFNASSKLFRHCREVHLVGPAREINQQERSKNYFPKHQAALVVPSPEPSPANRGSGTPVSMPSSIPGGPSGVNLAGMIQGGNQYNQSANQMQANTLANQNTYMGGRLTPQAMQQAMYQSSTGAAGYNNTGMSQNNSQASILQRQMTMAMNGLTQQQQTQQTGQPGSYGQQQQQQQQHSPAQQQQFSFQQQVNHLNQVNTIPQQPPGQQQIQQQHQPPQQQQQVIPAAHPTTAQVAPVQPHTELPAPIFVAPPPKPQRLQHSDAYLRYIEGLRDGSPHMNNWNQAHKPDASSMTPQQLAQLPVHWLGGGYGDHDNAVDALWALRDHMLRDALSLSRMSEGYTS